MNILYSRTSLNYLKKQSKKVQIKIINAIEQLPNKGDIKKLRGKHLKNIYRLRVGKYRVIFIIEKEVIKIIDINTRGDIY
jgi:mRNA interferase RelE/StbE